MASFELKVRRIATWAKRHGFQVEYHRNYGWRIHKDACLRAIYRSGAFMKLGFGAKTQYTKLTDEEAKKNLGFSRRRLAVAAQSPDACMELPSDGAIALSGSHHLSTTLGLISIFAVVFLVYWFLVRRVHRIRRITRNGRRKRLLTKCRSIKKKPSMMVLD